VQLESDCVASRFVFTGKSGAAYTYAPLGPQERLRPLAGNYIVAKVEGDQAEVLFAGETDNLMAVNWTELLDQGREAHGAADALVRLNVRGAVRREERDDLVEAYDPPMNRAGGVRRAG
jgi:hypothetical protein